MYEIDVFHIKHGNYIKQSDILLCKGKSLNLVSYHTPKAQVLCTNPHFL